MKKLLKLVLCSFVILSMAVSTVQAAVVSLKDVDVNDPSQDKIMWAIEQGYLKPVLGRFFPDKNVNRGEFAFILSKVSGDTIKLKNPTKATFSDVTKTHQFYKYIETMKTYINSFKGTGSTKLFKPKSYITREDAAMAVVKLLGFDSDEALMDGVESDISIEEIITDNNKISKANMKYVEIVVVNELMDFRMDDDGNIFFDPKKSLTRKDLAGLLWNATQQRDYLKEQYEEDGNYQEDGNTDEDNDNNDSDGGDTKPTNYGEDKDYPWNTNTNIKFENNGDYIGTWQCVAFVSSIDSYTPGMTQNFGLFFNKLTLRADGETDLSWLKWTNGRILNIGGDSSNSNLIIKEIEGKKYMFFQWISGDQLYRGMKPSWYVFEAINQ